MRKEVACVSPTTVAISLSCFSFASFFTLFPAYFPREAENRGYSKSLTGAAFIFQFIFTFIGSIKMHRIIDGFSRKGTVLLGISLHLPVALILGTIPFLDDTTFMVLAFLARLISGFAEACTLGSMFALINVVFPTRVPSLTAVLQVSMSVGFFSGPFFGGFLLDTWNFSTMYYAFGGYVLVVVVLVYFLLDKQIVNVTTDALASTPSANEEEGDLDQTTIDLGRVNRYAAIFSEKRAFFAALSQVVTLGNLVLVDAVITVYWQEEFGLSESFSGSMYSTTYIGLSFTPLVYPWICRFFHPRFFIFFGLTMESCMILLFYGPSRTMPNKWQVALVGMVLGKCFNGFTFISIMPEVTEACLERFQISNLPPEVGDKVGVINTATIAMGTIF